MEATRDSEAHASGLSVPTESDLSADSVHTTSSYHDSSYKESDSSTWSTFSSSCLLPTTTAVVDHSAASSSTSDLHAPVNSPNVTDTGKQTAVLSAASSAESLISGAPCGEMSLQHRMLLRSMGGGHQPCLLQRSTSSRPPCIGKEAMPACVRPRSWSQLQTATSRSTDREGSDDSKMHATRRACSEDDYLFFRNQVIQEKQREILEQAPSSSGYDVINLDVYDQKKKQTLLGKIRNLGKHFRATSRQKLYIQQSSSSENNF